MPAPTPDAWFQRLNKQLADRTPHYRDNERYVEGNMPAALGPDSASKTFQKFLRISKTNWSELILDALVERLEVVGYETAVPRAQGEPDPAWEVHKANGLVAQLPLTLGESCALGDSYMIVGPPRNGETVPTVTAETPFEVTTIDSYVRRDGPQAALKVYRDDWTDGMRAALFLPGHVGYYSHEGGESYRAGTADGWKFTGVSDRTPGETVPVVRFRNRPKLKSGPGRSEIQDVKSDLDRINTMLLQRVTIAILQAFKQRAVQGVPMDGSDDDFDWDDALRADPGSLWRLPEGVEMWESGAVDLNPILSAAKADVRDLAAKTRTPMHYLFPDSANGSAEGASLGREGLLFKSGNRTRQFADSMNEIQHYSMLWMGDEARADRLGLRTIWAPVERHSLAERHDAATKALAAGVPWRTVMSTVLQYTPEEIDRMEGERSEDAFLTLPFDDVAA